MAEAQRQGSTGARPGGWAVFWRWPLHWQILFGLIVGGLLGFLLATGALRRASAAGDIKAAVQIVQKGIPFLVFQLIGDLFLNGLKVIVIPLVTSSIVLAVSSIGAHAGFGRMGLKTLSYYMCTSFIAIMVGLTLVNAFTPGLNADGKGLLEGRDMAAFSSEAEALTQKVGDSSASSFLGVFRKMIPDNLVVAAHEGNLLGLIIASMVTGYFMTQLKGGPRKTFENFWNAVYEVSLKVTGLVLAFAPLGVGMLVAATVSENYAKLAPDDRFGEFLGGIVTFTLIVLAALAIHLLIVLPLIMRFIARVRPSRHFRAMSPALMTAFSTASSSATLPVTMECVEERAGVSNRTTSFVLPLGATVNMDGTALYECAAAMFVCQAMGFSLALPQQFFVVLVALLTSIGVAGVPSASLVAIVIILQSLERQLGVTGLVAALPILLVFDRLLDMCRTAVNIFSDSVGAVTIAKSEGETGVLEG
jgi:DAACS family dicarboxylate/amino acid:cation (Na+ or H+) symporter